MSIDQALSQLQDAYPDRFRSERHRSMISDLLRLYEQRGLLLGGEDAPLNLICCHRDPCWHHAEPPKEPESAGVSIPWIGRSYFQSHVCIVGMNSHDYGGLKAHYAVCREHMKAQRANRRGMRGEVFGRNAMRYLRLILASLDGEPF